MFRSNSPGSPLQGRGKNRRRGRGMDRGKDDVMDRGKNHKGISQMFNTSFYSNAQKLLTVLAGFVFVV